MKHRFWSGPFARFQKMRSVYLKRHDIIPMFKDMYQGNYKMPLGSLLLLALALLYLLSPIDLIPDFIFLLGWIDDLIIVGLASKVLDGALDRYRQHKAKVNFTNKNSSVILMKEKWR
jgi:uncharacterized membrane protein YkvA (DUF1232 family)